jgi:signal transduction histidine kinase
MSESAAPPDIKRQGARFGRGLSAKLLLMTIGFVMIAEVLIFVPSVANFRMRWLEDRVNTAAVAALVYVNNETGLLPRKVQDDILMATGAKSIGLKADGVSRLLAIEEMPQKVDRHFYLKQTGVFHSITDAFETLIYGGARSIRVHAPIADSAKEIDLVISDAPLVAAIWVYARNVFILSLIISLITGGLLFLGLNRLLIKPIRNMTANMLKFADTPEDKALVITDSGRSDEMGVAERELGAMQRHLQEALSERKHLADLGLAISKINHDMRNLLAPAQLLSDRLAEAEDPLVQRIAPRIMRALDRAVTYSESVMAYGRAKEAPPSRKMTALRPLAADVIELLGLDTESRVEVSNQIDADLMIDADPDQLFRVLANLCRNSVHAMTAMPDQRAPRRLVITGGRMGNTALIGVEDTGPGLSAPAREHLYSAFRGSTHAGGTGLGLAIAHEIVRAHGGTLELRADRDTGAHFEIRIPDQPVSISEWKQRKGVAGSA